MTRISPFIRDLLDFEPNPALAKSIAETQADIRAAFRRRLARTCMGQRTDLRPTPRPLRPHHLMPHLWLPGCDHPRSRDGLQAMRDDDRSQQRAGEGDEMNEITIEVTETPAGRLRYLAAKLECLDHKPDANDILEIEQSADELERLQALLDQDFKKATEIHLRHAGPGPDGSFKFDLQASIIPLIAEHLAQTFKAMGGENYVTIEVNHDELGPLELTMQRRWGEMPAAKAARLAAEIASLKAENEKLREALKPFAEIAERDLPEVPIAYLEKARAALSLAEGKTS